PVKSVRQVNLMEEGESAPLDVSNNSVKLRLRPFEIATLLVKTA
ncbi:MAG: alpha-mannosidase, partial [Devosia sp.]|nr:alpha-mannosidase [Devosia sp.]